MLIDSPKSTAHQIQVSWRRFAPALALIALCLPSLLFVWHNRDIPHFGILQDDGLYFISGKALAHDSGYRILSLSGEPFQTKYPPLYPWLLSLAWRINPSYPTNLSLALMLSWACFPLVVLLIFTWLRRNGFPIAVTWLVVALFALNPYVLFFASNLVSEIFFMLFLFGVILAVERENQLSWKWPLGAGIIAGFAYLARTAGIALLPAAIAYYLWKRQPRGAVWFAVGMLPALAGWTLWNRSHAAPGQDVVTLCYTNYIGYQLLNVGWDNIGQVLWNNVDSLLLAMGSLIFPQMLVGLPAKLILQPLGVAMILGCVRMGAKGHGRFYALFGGISLAMLLVWHFRPNQRFILPLAPVLLTGFCFEMKHLAGLFRGAFGHRDRSQRVVAYGFAAILIAILAGGLGFQAYMGFSVVPELARNDRANALEYARFYQWIARNLPADANVMWENDTALYLGSGHRATNHVVLPRDWYATGGDSGEAARYQRIDAFAREHHLDYVAVTKIGLQRNEEVLHVVAANTNLERIHEESGAILYRVRQ